MKFVKPLFLCGVDPGPVNLGIAFGAVTEFDEETKTWTFIIDGSRTKNVRLCDAKSRSWVMAQGARRVFSAIFPEELGRKMMVCMEQQICIGNNAENMMLEGVIAGYLKGAYNCPVHTFPSKTVKTTFGIASGDHAQNKKLVVDFFKGVGLDDNHVCDALLQIHYMLSVQHMCLGADRGQKHKVEYTMASESEFQELIKAWNVEIPVDAKGLETLVSVEEIPPWEEEEL